MKTSYYFILTVITSLILSSCGNGTSIMKRRYSKGFYVHHSQKLKNENKQLAVATPVTVDRNSTTNVHQIPQSPQTVEQPASNGTSEQVTRMEKHPKNNPVGKRVSQLIKLASVDPLVRTALKLAPQHQLGKADYRAAREGDALSLIWILIVIIAVIYLIGLLMNDFGLGGIFHILGVILIVLLILWLLRII